MAELPVPPSRLRRQGTHPRIICLGNSLPSCRETTAEPERRVGSFSEDRPLGWAPVARRAIGRAMEWPATTATAASGGNREPLLGPRPARCERMRSRCWEPQPVFVSEEKAAGTPTLTGRSSILCQAVFYRILPPVTSPLKDFVVLAELLHYTKERNVETVRFCRRFDQWI